MHSQATIKSQEFIVTDGFVKARVGKLSAEGFKTDRGASSTANGSAQREP